ncbi:unnamed protein product [Dovyalis caffra]|uniref:VQ domain-containing protein n=1 Tax=Dovyalis caffra TaxID=77055 RepID=A0AAV1S6S6_9ROSI|nr:unnamed protein product [Dovyalis caffra]
MGTKVSQASMKISKNENNQLRSLIKVLRPKIYITDSSSFKRLVQELTGNGRTIPSPPPPSKHQTELENVAIVNVEAQGEHESGMETSLDASVDSFDICNQLVSLTEELNQPCNHGEPESSMETSFDASVHSFKFCNQLVPVPEELNQPYNQLHFDDVTSDHLLTNQQTDVLTGQDFESLLLDIEQYPFSSSYSQIHQLEESLDRLYRIHKKQDMRLGIIQEAFVRGNHADYSHYSKRISSCMIVAKVSVSLAFPMEMKCNYLGIQVENDVREAGDIALFPIAANSLVLSLKPLCLVLPWPGAGSAKSTGIGSLRGFEKKWKMRKG